MWPKKETHNFDIGIIHMAQTNFALLTDEQKTVWSKQIWHHARHYAFLSKFTGTGQDAMIQEINELTKSEKGARAVITLLADLEGDGVVGDNRLEGNEEGMRSFDQVISIDQMRHANLHEGRMADQKSVVRFRSNSRDALGYWLADRLDQLAFLTLSGVSYAMHNNGRPRVGSYFNMLEFAKDVSPPTDQRRFRWNNATKTLESAGSTTNLVAADKPTWQLFVDMKAHLKDQKVRPIRGGQGEEMYHVFMTPQAMARLKLDPDYMANMRSAQARSNKNPLFTGSSVEVDGLMLHEFTHVYNTSGAPSGSKWGASGTVDGCQMLFCGAQAMAMADIGDSTWVEEGFDYENQQGISVAKIVGFLKPKFNSMYSGNSVQDFGVASVYVSTK
jgi:N4-gp56 family major capsid protein